MSQSRIASAFTLVELLVVIAILGLLVGVGFTGCGGCSSSTAQIHVTKTWTKRVSDGSDTYLVGTKNNGNFKCEDSLRDWHFNASDVWAALEPGHMYTVNIRGFRSGWMSRYPNIYEIVEDHGPVDKAGEKPKVPTSPTGNKEGEIKPLNSG